MEDTNQGRSDSKRVFCIVLTYNDASSHAGEAEQYLRRCLRQNERSDFPAAAFR